MAGETRLTSPPQTVPPSIDQSGLVFAAARFGFPARWHTCTCGARHSPHPASSRRCRSARCSPHSSPTRNPPSLSQVMTSRSRAVEATPSSLSRAPSGSIFGCRRRDRGRGQRIRRQLPAQVPQELPPPVSLGRQPGPGQLIAQLPVHPQSHHLLLDGKSYRPRRRPGQHKPASASRGRHDQRRRLRRRSPLTRGCRARAGGRAAPRVRGRPLQPKRDCRRRTTSTGGKCLVNVHAKSRLAWSLCLPRGQAARARPAGLPSPGRGASDDPVTGTTDDPQH